MSPPFRYYTRCISTLSRVARLLAALFSYYRYRDILDAMLKAPIQRRIWYPVTPGQIAKRDTIDVMNWASALSLLQKLAERDSRLPPLPERALAYAVHF